MTQLHDFTTKMLKQVYISYTEKNLHLWLPVDLNPIQTIRQGVDNNDNVAKLCWNNSPSVIPVVL